MIKVEQYWPELGYVSILEPSSMANLKPIKAQPWCQRWSQSYPNFKARKFMYTWKVGLDTGE